MIHSVISWDCCYRNFFHLISALSEQEYPKDQYELIYVEQKSRKISDAFNHKLGLMSLQDTVDLYKDRFNVRAVFLSRSHIPYHLGICNNAGIRLARGKYISVMDGDLLVKPDFLSRLEEGHKTLKTIFNLERRYSVRPVGVDFDNWTKGVIDFDLCLSESPDRDLPISARVENKGPLISAPREWWEAVGGYDEHRIWSTGVSRLGQDITARLEIYARRESLALPGHICVHPYHPAGFDRGGQIELIVLTAQQRLINFARNHNEPSYVKRKFFTEKNYRKYKWAVEANITGHPDVKGKINLGICSFRSIRIVKNLFLSPTKKILGKFRKGKRRVSA